MKKTMKKQILVISAHPDDETFGSGGTLLRHVAEGDAVHWLILTEMQPDLGYSREQIARREKEIEAVARQFSFSSVHPLRFPTTKLDAIPRGDLVKKISSVFKQTEPEVIYMPYGGDVHTDHQVASEAAIACTKWFRQNSVKRILAYECLSETDLAIDPKTMSFRPNVFINIEDTLEKKLEIMKIYESELGEFPFPRSTQAVRALAHLRGQSAGFKAAEAFMLLKELL